VIVYCVFGHGYVLYEKAEQYPLPTMDTSR